MFIAFDHNIRRKLRRSDIQLFICRSSGACEIWILECYKHHAPLALKAENLDSNDL
jgi:hypothetical protein